MAKARIRTVLNGTVSLCAAFAAIHAPAAMAAPKSDTAGSAQGRVLIMKPLGTRIAFDALTDSVSGAFLEGLPGDAVSLVLPSLNRPARIPVEVLVLSTETYDLTGTILPENDPGNDRGRVLRAGIGQDGGNLLFLAQFN